MTTKVPDTMLEGGGGGGTSAAIPPGTVVDFAGSTAPEGWVFCFGQLLSRTTYAALFAALGTTYGAGDGSTTFGLPDCRGRVSLGRDNMGGTPANRVTEAQTGLNATTLGATGGDQRLHAHSHNAVVTDPGHFHNVGSRQNDTPNDFIAAGAGITTGGQTTSTNTTGISVEISTAGGGSSQNIPPAIVLNKIIKT